MKKIVITGGIGYIGTEICKIYSGESWNNQITVIDNRFISERVNQLRKWNMNFVHADIRKIDEVKKYLNKYKNEQIWILCYIDLDLTNCKIPINEDQFIVNENLNFSKINLKRISYK